MNFEQLSQDTKFIIHSNWLEEWESVIQLARKCSLWNLWLEKYSYLWMTRCDKAFEAIKEKIKAQPKTGIKQKERDISKDYPSGKATALLIAKELAKNGQLSEPCKNKLEFIDRLQKFYGDRVRVVELVNESRLMLHLGRASVLENVGLYAERITGLPTIPGTSLKGVLSAWAFWEVNKEKGTLYGRDEKSFIKKRKGFNLLEQIFGDDSEGSEHSGEIVFVGGFPSFPPELGLDIVNPHFDEKGKEKERLTPNTFLCVEPGTVWKFIFFARAGAPNYRQLLDQTERMLIECLTQAGIGAKTAAGYGRFRHADDEDRQEVKRLWRELEKSEPEIPPVSGTTVRAGKTSQPPQPPKPAPTPPPQIVPFSGDYENEQMFKNLVLNNLEPSKLDNLKKEIEKLKKPENAEWLQKLKDYLKKNKEIRKKLQSKDWFPKEWVS